MIYSQCKVMTDTFACVMLAKQLLFPTKIKLTTVINKVTHVHTITSNGFLNAIRNS